MMSCMPLQRAFAKHAAFVCGSRRAFRRAIMRCAREARLPAKRANAPASGASSAVGAFLRRNCPGVRDGWPAEDFVSPRARGVPY